MSLADYAKALGGDVVGKGRIMCPGPYHSPNDRSLSVTFTSAGFLVHSFSNDDWKTCRDHVRAALGLGGEAHFARPSAEDLEKIRQDEERLAIQQEQRAIDCWKASKPIGGTIAESYLRRRGISCSLPESLRFHPDCRHPGTSRLPAMVAAVEGAERFAVHRTYLHPDGTGKADIEPAKAMLGAVAGGAVRLTASGFRIVVCEGIETGLSLASGLVHGSPTIWAALSTSGMKRLALPGQPGSLLVATDGDDAGRAAGNVLAERAVALGWQVNLLPAPDGQDWNDVLKGSANDRG
ncbi:toprim domain-containing protein [Rhizobium sp. LjRoot30]|uniref:DUF7146 domain-containing protein n=1 Tax=Rhizobium sp. LjRoot30 TaxID=3342320 RepID=UPI003ECD8726